MGNSWTVPVSLNISGGHKPILTGNGHIMKTKSEEVFEAFLVANNIHFEKIEEVREKATYRPDYLVTVGSHQLVIELKEIDEDDDFEVVKDPRCPHIKSASRIIGDHVRRRIDGARKQIQYGAEQGIPALLLIYNNLDRVFQMFGTEDTDFIAAMYGEFTIQLNITSGDSSEIFNGKRRLLQESKNTSFSAIVRVSDLGGNTVVTLFENIFAKVKVPYEQLPPCFDIRRVEVS